MRVRLWPLRLDLIELWFQFPVEMVCNPPWEQPFLGLKDCLAHKQTAMWYVVPTGKDNFIVSAGRPNMVPAGRTIVSPGSIIFGPEIMKMIVYEVSAYDTVIPLVCANKGRHGLSYFTHLHRFFITPNLALTAIPDIPCIIPSDRKSAIVTLQGETGAIRIPGFGLS
ncbi:hypothetical protein Tco_0880134 [Tanacetum coccineum]